MPVNIQFELDGEVVSRSLGTVADDIKDFREPLNEIGKDLLKAFDMNFSQRGKLYGGWPARSKEQPWPLMENTGRMRKAFEMDVSDSAVAIWNPTPYFKYHQSSLPRTIIPRRVMMKLRQQDAEMIVKAFQKYIVGILRSRGLR